MKVGIDLVMRMRGLAGGVVGERHCFVYLCLAAGSIVMKQIFYC